jgi:hypothetical protein
MWFLGRPTITALLSFRGRTGGLPLLPVNVGCGCHLRDRPQVRHIGKYLIYFHVLHFLPIIAR